MAFGRRTLLKGGAAGLATAALAGRSGPDRAEALDMPAPEAPALETPAFEVIALNRMAYGPRPGDLERVRSIGLAAYVDEQLNPGADPDCDARIAAATLRIKYQADDGSAVDELRPLGLLGKTRAELWLVGKHPANPERIRGADEVRAATWLRAVYSPWQLREVLAEFWHNHFNVNAYSDTRIAASWPAYDRDVIRANCLGNFRAMLESVATSVAMLYYLDNATSRDGPANENYARELFELHTLGSDNYFNTLYDDWQQVPGAEIRQPTGYIDHDVYEAARAFTGWTLEDGSHTGSERLPDTGNFRYYDLWHDNAQKIVLATSLGANQGPMAHGRRVLDLVAYHPGTARAICAKLCRRLLGDAPPTALVERAAKIWIDNKTAPDQIKQTVRTILLSPEWAAAWGQKVKRPFEQIASFLRCTGAEVTPNAALFNQTAGAGYLQFAWPTPTGHPDTASYWLTTNALLSTWNLIYSLLQPNFDAAAIDLRGQIPAGAKTSRQIVDFWVARMLGRPAAAATYAQLLALMAQGGSPDAPPAGGDNDLTARINSLVHLIAMSPDFQWR
ncbi:MAG TPA: DUF1800 domain-containing protein [Herpetosiphonaceae bacterium]|nr:DUF1800 domain-containing protein [Herpetosiphonaceae bacterium]